jgi:type I restriction enzyme M protein
MPIKKTELYSSLWKSCDDLRGGMDSSQYKDYILVLLFVKYVSDKYANVPFSAFKVPEGGSFKDMVAAKNKDDVGDQVNKIIEKLAEANNLRGVITITDFNNEEKLGKGKALVDRVSKLIAVFEDKFDFSRNRAENDDILGDAYEYLMRNFATESGKSKGQFYTPSEVSRVMAKVVGVANATSQEQTIYDPTCGSGSLLIKAADETPHKLSIYGQEMDNSTRALAKMNMYMHGHPNAIIHQDNTLAEPFFKNQHDQNTLKTFDFAVANPPFSTKSWSLGFLPEEDVFQRFEYGIPPAKNGDYAFLLHIIKSLKSNGKGAIILPHGVLFRGNAEATIRENLIRKGFIKGIIALPPNLFYGTGIPACIIVIDKENAENRWGIFMVDAGKGFMKDGNKNRLRHQDIHKIVDVFNNQIEIEKFSRMVSHAEIERNEFNLNIPRYIDSQEPEDIQDIEAHLLGGIPNFDVDALGNYWQVFSTLKNELFANSTRENYSSLKIEPAAIKETIYGHSEFIAYSDEINQIFNNWRMRHTSALQNISSDTKPKELIHFISEDLLKSFAFVRLVDKYDVYQQLMTYWTETMQDDVYMIALDGWQANEDLIPHELIINRYFAEEQEAIETLEAEKESITREREELEEEHNVEEGKFEAARDETTDKLTKLSVKERIRKLKFENDLGDEFKLLEKHLELVDSEAAANRNVRTAKAELDLLVFNKYGKLGRDEIISLVVDYKWMTTLETAISAEIERVAQNLTQRIKTLAERYKTPLSKIAEKSEELSAKVDEHLAEMGFYFDVKIKASSNF